MKISELLTEDKKLDQTLNEGPIAKGIGKAVGGVAKGVGAVAGGVAGMGRAFKKGYQSGKATVGGDETPSTGDSATTQGVKSGINKALRAKAFNVDPRVPSAQQTRAPSAQEINTAGPTGTAPAKQQTGKAAQAMQKTAQAMAGQNQAQAGQTLYAQVKSQVGQLDKKGKQRILQLLQKSLQQTPAAAQPAASTVAAPKRGQPVKVAGQQNPKVARLLQPQTAGKENTGTLIAESFSLYRKR